MASHEAVIREGLTARFDLTPDLNGRAVLTKLTLEGWPITADDLRKLSVRELEAREWPDTAEPPANPLTRPAGADPAAHSRLVAEHYRWHAARVPNPATFMAASAGVPVRTVHTWIREARLRGLLPVGRRGKVM